MRGELPSIIVRWSHTANQGSRVLDPTSGEDGRVKRALYV